MQLLIFLIALFVWTYRLSSHARLEAFVIQTKLNLLLVQLTRTACNAQELSAKNYQDAGCSLDDHYNFGQECVQCSGAFCQKLSRCWLQP